MKKIIITTLLFMFLCGGSVLAKIDEILETIEIDDASKVVLRCDLGAGEFKILPDDMDAAAKIFIEYNPRRVDYIIDDDIKRNTLFIDLESETRRKSSIDTEDNLWEITLSKNYPIALNFDMGACDAEIDLSGVPVTEFIMEIGAASGLITFDEPNPERLEIISIEAGASSLEMTDIGNANFEMFSFEGGVGSFDFDFRGKYANESEIEIELGLGSAELILPRGIPVRIEADGDNFLSSIDIHKNMLDEVDDDIYESEDFDDAEVRIIVRLEVGLGSIDVYFK